MLPGISSDALIDGDIKGESFIIICYFHASFCFDVGAASFISRP